MTDKEANTGSGEDEWATGARIKRSSLLSLNASLTTGLLFFFALGSDIMGRNLIIYVNLLPFTAFTFALLNVLRNKYDKAIKQTQVGLIALAISIVVIALDSFFGNPISDYVNLQINQTEQRITPPSYLYQTPNFILMFYNRLNDNCIYRFVTPNL